MPGDDGDEQVQSIALGDLPNFSFRFSSDPDMKPQDEREAAATNDLIGTIEQRPWAVDLVAQRNHMSPAIVRKAKQDFARFQSRLAAAPPAGAPAQGPPGGVPGQAGVGPQAVESPSAMVARLIAAGPQQVGG